MNNYPGNRRLPQNAQLRRDIDKLLQEGDSFIQSSFKDLDIYGYRYNIQDAVYELDLDEDTVYQLVEDYVIQILKSKTTFFEYIQKLKKDEFDNKVLDYTDIRNLAHKNLGVVRNLRIRDAEKLLNIIMQEENLDYIRLCVKALEITAVKLNPLCAYETLKLIRIKNSL